MSLQSQWSFMRNPTKHDQTKHQQNRLKKIGGQSFNVFCRVCWNNYENGIKPKPQSISNLHIIKHYLREMHPTTEEG